MSATKEKQEKITPPDIGRHFLVQCVGYRGLAYQNRLGQWKAMNSNRILPKEIEIIP